MIALLRAHGADDGQLVHVLGHTWKDLGNLHTGGIRRDGPESAIRFNVPGVEVAEAAFEPQQKQALALPGVVAAKAAEPARRNRSRCVAPRKLSAPARRNHCRVMPSLFIAVRS